MISKCLSLLPTNIVGFALYKIASDGTLTMQPTS